MIQPPYRKTQLIASSMSNSISSGLVSTAAFSAAKAWKMVPWCPMSPMRWKHEVWSLTQYPQLMSCKPFKHIENCGSDSENSSELDTANNNALLINDSFSKSFPSLWIIPSRRPTQRVRNKARCTLRSAAAAAADLASISRKEESLRRWVVPCIHQGC